MNEELKTQLKSLGLNDEQIGKLEADGVKSTDDIALLDANEIKTSTGCTTVVAKKVVAEVQKMKAAAEPPPATTAAQASLDVLPTVPDDASWLDMLKIGGVAKVQVVDVIAAIRAAIASRVGLYELPDILVARMEEFAESQDEPVGENFFRLQKLVTSRSYADVLAAIGATGQFVNEKRKREMVRKLNELLWPSLQSFHGQLKGWAESWAQAGSNPAMILSVLAVGIGGGQGAVMPPGMLQPPDTAGLRDEAEGVINTINKIFGGLGIPVARAMGYDALRIREVLEDPALPAAVGATNKEQMLKMLNVAVGADYVRLERNIVRYALAIMELTKVTSGNSEYQYLGAMLQLGSAIPWDKLGGRGLKEGGASLEVPFRGKRTTNEF